MLELRDRYYYYYYFKMNTTTPPSKIWRADS